MAAVVSACSSLSCASTRSTASAAALEASRATRSAGNPAPRTHTDLHSAHPDDDSAYKWDIWSDYRIAPAAAPSAHRRAYIDVANQPSYGDRTFVSTGGSAMTAKAEQLQPKDARPSGTSIGALLKLEPNCLRVMEVNLGGGAHAAGIVAGDRVVGVDGVTIAKLGHEGAIAKLLGAPGVPVAVTLFRNNAPVT